MFTFPVKILYNTFKELIILNRIKQLRNEKNINQDVLAKLLRLEVPGISKLETERVPLKDEYILKLAEFFEVSTDYLLCKSNIRNINELNLLDTSGLDEEDLKELQSQIAYMKWKKENLKQKPKH